MLTQLTLEELSGRYAGNEQRKRLFDLFVDELKSIQAQCSRLRVLVFGSYITGKNSPRDIDVLISLIPSDDCMYTLWTEGLHREHPDEVDVHYYKTQRYIKDAEGLLVHFNNNRINELQGIAIRDAVEIIGI
jgi:predicted nucleotidyltransferase